MAPKTPMHWTQRKTKKYVEKASENYLQARQKHGIGSKEETLARIKHHKAIIRQAKEHQKLAKTDKERAQILSHINANERQAKAGIKSLEMKK